MTVSQSSPQHRSPAPQPPQHPHPPARWLPTTRFPWAFHSADYQLLRSRVWLWSWNLPNVEELLMFTPQMRPTQPPPRPPPPPEVTDKFEDPSVGRWADCLGERLRVASLLNLSKYFPARFTSLPKLLALPFTRLAWSTRITRACSSRRSRRTSCAGS